MVQLNSELIQSKKFKDEFDRITRTGDLTKLTASDIRGRLEERFKLDRDALKKQPWKAMINEMIEDYMTSVVDQDEEDEPAEEEDTAREETKVSEDENAKKEDSKVTEAEKEGSYTNTKKKPTKKRVDPGETEMKLIRKRKRRVSPAVGNTTDDSDQSKDKHRDSGSDDFASDESTEPTKRKKTRPRKKENELLPEKSKGTGSKSKVANKTDDDTIRRLKSFVYKCGVRKVWNKELADCTTKKSQINKIKSILAELGVEGRPSIEKCEAIKAARELKAELAGLDTTSILETNSRGPSLRSARLKTPTKKQHTITKENDEGDDDEDDDSNDAGDDDSDSEAVYPATLDVSFLGDQSGDDSD